MTVAVFFGAHPDDVELGAGATCAKLCAAGFEVRIVVASDDRNPRTAAIRRDEAIAAARLLGVPATRVHYLGLSDGHFRCNRETVEQVRALFLSLSVCPDAIFTHSEADSHQDHVELTRIVKAAFRHAGIFKYQVSNSAIASHFRPSVSSEIGAFGDLKTAALRCHRSQILLGRVSPLRPTCHDFETFELEVQEGATRFFTILARLHDAPFGRFWLPVCARGSITLLAPSAQHSPQRSSVRVISRTPSDLLLVTRLQAALMNVMETRLAAGPGIAFTVEEAGTDFVPPSSGTTLILGGPAVNPAARPFLEQIPALRYRMDFASAQRCGQPIIDTRSEAVLGASFVAADDASLVLTHDHGLLTLARMSGHPASEASLVIAIMGVHAAGTAAALACLMPEHVARIVDAARRVIDGAAGWAQWLVPCDCAGVPMLAEIREQVDEGPPPRSRPAERSPTERFAQISQMSARHAR
jgi:LmbE family N-acetylglucosaminyl deacetylase